MRIKSMAIVALLVFGLTACVQKMGMEGRLIQGSIMPRDQLPGTVASGSSEDTADLKPARLSRALLHRGRERYDIYCSACHGEAGYGDGMVVQRGFLAPPSYHIDRLRNAPDRHLFDVITNGYGAMYGYDDKIEEFDRWAIVGYIRALQLSQNRRLKQLPPSEQRP